LSEVILSLLFFKENLKLLSLGLKLENS